MSLPGFTTSKSKKEPSYYQKTGVPGPGEYNPVLIRKQEGNYQLGKSTKLPWEKKDTPGPGYYDPQKTDTRLKIALKSRLTDIEMEHKKQLPVRVNIGTRAVQSSRRGQRLSLHIQSTERACLFAERKQDGACARGV
jgi:hypothetical protein